MSEGTNTPATTTAATQEEATRTTVESLGENPIALLAGGVAVGVLVGMLIPRLAKEREVLDPVGRKLAGNVSEAAKAAREAGQAEIQALLPDKGATKERVSQLIQTVLEAAKGAGAKA